MIEVPKSTDLVWALVPFFSDRKTSGFNSKVGTLQQTVSRLKPNIDKIIVINDGSGEFIRPEGTDIFLNLPVNRGKAEAVRTGLKAILAQTEYPVGYILQTDADLDQEPGDAKLLLDKFSEHNINPDQPALVVGDRYYQGAPANKLEYRQSMLQFQDALSAQLGSTLRDYNSGFRAYTRSYAEKFLELSHSTNYGIEAEQAIIAYLIGAKVETVPLTYSRDRDPFTLTNKLCQALEAILIHSNPLEERGLGKLVAMFKNIERHVQRGDASFKVNLSLDSGIGLEFEELAGNRMTASILECKK